MKPPKLLAFLYVLFFCGATVTAQERASSTLLQQPGKLYSSIADKASAIDGQLEKATDKYLSKLQKLEGKLKEKLFKKNSSLAHQLFDGVDEKYASLKTTTQKLAASASVYSGHLDSLTTSLKFLQNNPLTNKADIGKSLGRLSSLQQKLNQTETIKKFIQERKQILKSSMEKLNMQKHLKGFQKQAYYYQARILEIKSLWENPAKMEQRILEEVIKLPAFKEFFQQNSMLGSLFALPGGSNGNATASLAGLQTRASVMAGITQRFGAGAPR